MERPSSLAREPVSATARTPWLPVGMASAATAIAVLWMLLWLFAVALFLSSPDDVMPRGIRVIDPSTTEVVGAIARRVGLPLLAVMSLVVTWRSGHQRRVHRCWLAAITTIGLAVAAFIV